MKNIQIAEIIREHCPNFICASVTANVSNTSYNENLWSEIAQYIDKYKKSETIEDIKKNKRIEATRKAYKALGKESNRYRPSSESLRRRLQHDFSLYKVNTLVDLINLVSLKSGYTISGLDYDKISGEQLTLDVGNSDDLYEGIGRGLLNIDKMPVYRDEKGGIGTPTSDNERTKLDLNTQRILILINSFDGEISVLEETTLWIEKLIKQYADAKGIRANYFR